jgi:2-polyprenyl-6-methoxyphenol hydroxylase-like FAD-dependent oxidoreductase
VGWRFIVHRPPGRDGWKVFLGPRSAFLMLPISHDRAYCYADKSNAQPLQDPTLGSIERLREEFADFASPVREVLARFQSSEPIHFSPIEEAAQQCFGRGLVVLIGDAAHAMSPNMACGAAMAFEDALVLAEIVSRAGAVSEVVPELIHRRSARTEWVRSQTDQRDRTRNLPHAVRDIFLRLFGDRLYRANYRPLLAPR